MDHQDFVLLVTLVMLLIEMLQEVVLGTIPTNSTIFQIDFTKDMAEGTYQMKVCSSSFCIGRT
jgi:hypothetical protein